MVASLHGHLEVGQDAAGSPSQRQGPRAKGLNDRASTQHRRFTLQEEHLGMAVGTRDTHEDFHHPMTPALTIASKVVAASEEVDLIDGIPLRFQEHQISAGRTEAT